MQVCIKDVDIYYEQHGSTGPKTLLLHGWGCHTDLFAPITKALAECMQITVIDFPAHGKSGRPPEPWGVKEFAEMTRELILQLDLAPCHIICHSFGGRVALYLDSHWPELVDRMIITGGAGLKEAPSEAAKKRSEEYKRLRSGIELIKKTHLFGGLPEKWEEMARKKYGSADYNALDAEMRKTFVKIISEDLRPLLPSIKASTLLIWGDQDTATPLWMGQTMEKEIPDAGLVVFEGGTHYAYLEQWQRFTAIAKNFLLKE